MRRNAASSVHPSSSSPHRKLFHFSAMVGLCHDGQGFRKPAVSFSVSEGRVGPGDGAHEGRYEAQPDGASAVLTATIWCSGGLVPDLAFVTSPRVSMVKSNQAYVGGSCRIQTRCGRVLSPCRVVGGGGIQGPWSGRPNSRALIAPLSPPPSWPARPTLGPLSCTTQPASPGTDPCTNQVAGSS
jgi:hypothetical protein